MSEDSADVHNFLFSSPARKEAFRQLTRLATDGSYDGINLQLNALDPSDRESFASWVTDLANQLHRNGKLLCISFKPQLFHLEFSTADPNLVRIGKAADQIKLIALNYPGDRPGPSSSMAWLNKILENGAKQIPPAKLHLDLPLSGAHWVDNKLEEFLSVSQVLHLLRDIGGEPERDANGELHAVFHLLGITHTVYCQDEETVRFKTEAIRKNRPIAGIFTDEAQEEPSELPGLLSKLFP
jgi:spore germination protein YaaH